MFLKSKMAFLLLVVAAVFSSNTQKLLNISVDAQDRDTVDGDPTGATCN